MNKEKTQKTKIEAAIDDTKLRLEDARRRWSKILVEVDTLEQQLRTLEIINENKDLN
jgi:vacuolar-type H+-ATPase subunit H